MRCPACQKENPQQAKFCNGCGNPLGQPCPKCTWENPPGSKFCNECGARLPLSTEPLPRELPLDKQREKILNFIPGGVAEKILSQRGKIEGERKQVTVMFCDMARFSEISERLGPEELYSVMDDVYEILIRKVYAYGGTVNDMAGDGIMALFGAPIALEDAPQRALRAASAIHRAMARLTEGMREKTPAVGPMRMRIGVHTGPVVVGSLGNDLRLEFTALGDTVNLASRMESIAEPGTTYVTEATFKLAEGFFRFEALGERKVKGREGPVRVYQAIASGTRRNRFDISAERGLMPFIGRERELELLLEGLERVKGGRGQAFSIVAEAGMGKSRLLYEFRKAVANEDITFLEGRCLSYGREIVYHPVIDILKSSFDIQEGGTESEIRQKVKEGLRGLGVDEKAYLPHFLELLSFHEGGEEEFLMTAEARKDRIIEALKRIVLRGSEFRPLVMAFEDLHWIDKTSEDALKHVLDSLGGARVFLILTYRPEFVHTWGSKSYHSHVTLNRLSNRETLALVTHLLGTGELGKDLEELILEKTEGIPFFVEEFIRSLKDLHIIEKKNGRYYLAKRTSDVTIPSTIQDVIMARVDSLPEGPKAILQTGAAIEREFSYELIKRVTGLPEPELLTHLSILKDSEIIDERGIYPRSTCVFRHTLTREVVYDSILSKRKKTLHGQIADAMETLYRNNLDEYYEILTEHYVRTGHFEKGAEYARLASRKAERAGSLKNAIAYSEKAIACLERLPPQEDVQKKLLDTKTKVGLYYAEMIQLDQAMKEVESVAELAKELNYKKPLPKIYSISGTYHYFVKEDFCTAFGHLEQSITISRELDDIPSLVLGNTWLGVASAFCCQFEKSLRYFEKSLDLSAQSNSLWGISIGKSNMSLFGYNWQGKLDLGLQASDEAIQFAERSGDIYSKSIAYTCHGWSHYYKGRLNEAEHYLTTACTSFEKIDVFSFWALAELCLGLIHFEKGDVSRAVEHHKKSIALFRSANIFPSFVNFNELAIQRAKAFGGESGLPLEQLAEHEKANRFKIYEGWIPCLIAEILLRAKEPSLPAVEGWILKAIAADEQNGMSWNLGRDYLLLAGLWERRTNREEAEKNLRQAEMIFKACGAEGDLKRAESRWMANTRGV